VFRCRGGIRSIPRSGFTPIHGVAVIDVRINGLDDGRERCGLVCGGSFGRHLTDDFGVHDLRFRGRRSSGRLAFSLGLDGRFVFLNFEDLTAKRVGAAHALAPQLRIDLVTAPANGAVDTDQHGG
jgi:hypothetical protein